MVPTSKKIDSAASTSCKIKDEVINNKQMKMLHYGTVKIHLSGLTYAFFNKDTIDNILSDDLADATIKSFKEFVKSRPAEDSFALYIDDANMTNYFYFKDEATDYDYVEYLNKQIAVNVTYQGNFNKLPIIYDNKIEVKFIFDYTRPIADEELAREYFSKQMMYNPGSVDCALPEPTTQNMSQSYMFMNNEAVDLVWDITSKPDQVKVTTPTGAAQSPFFYEKIYKCKTYFNMIPFASNPAGIKSYCGIGFTYGDISSTAAGLNANLIFIKQKGADGAGDFECIVKARALQRFITDKCSKGRPETKAECFIEAKTAKKAEEKKPAAAVTKEEPKPVGEDVEEKPTGTKVAMEIQKSADQTAQATAQAAQDSFPAEPLYSVKVDLKSDKHVPSVDVFRNLDKVLSNQLLLTEELDTAKYFKGELNSRSLRNNVTVMSKEEQDILFNQILKSIQDDQAQEDKQESVGKVQTQVLNYRYMGTEAREKANAQEAASKRKIHKLRDNVLVNHGSFESDLYFCRRVKDLKMRGRGIGYKLIELLYADLKKMCPGPFDGGSMGEDMGLPTAALEKDSFYWFDLEEEGEKLRRKLFKNAGVQNGDVLELKQGCCQTFTSQRAALVAEWCHSTMRWKVGKGAWHFVSLYGTPVDAQAFITEFTKDSCANMDEIMSMLTDLAKPDVKVVVAAGGPVIQDGDLTTRVNPDGTVYNADPTGTSTDSPASSDAAVGPAAAAAAAAAAPGSPEAAAAAAAAGAAPGSPAAAAASRPAAAVSDAVDDAADPITDVPLSGKARGPPASTPGKPSPIAGAAAVEEEKYDKYDIGHYDVWVDSANKATIRTKKTGIDFNKKENVMDGYREGDVIYIKFKNGDQIKFYYKKNELVRISADKNIVAKIYPDKSKIVDDKSKKTKEINNKYGISTVFDVEHNKIMDQPVKFHFKYNDSVVYMMEDGTLVQKIADGHMLIMNADHNKTVLDKEGHIESTEDHRFKLRYHFAQSARPLVSDQTNEVQQPFYQNSNSQFLRLDGILYEVLPNHIKLKVNPDGSKTRYTSNRKEVCYPNMQGYVFNKLERYTYICKCSIDYIVDEWSCKKSVGYNYVLKLLQMQNTPPKGYDYILNNSRQTYDIYASNFEFLKYIQSKNNKRI